MQCLDPNKKPGVYTSNNEYLACLSIACMLEEKDNVNMPALPRPGL